MRFFLAMLAARACGLLIKLVAKNRGTDLPGKVALKIDPRFVAHIKGVDPAKAIFVTGTNGKSTAVNIIHHILSHSGRTVCANLKGANLLSGVATSMIPDCTLGGQFKKDYVVMETDERYLALIRDQLPAKYVCLTNIQRDQAQRNGEPSYIIRRIAQMLDSDMTLFLNMDEPNSMSLASLHKGRLLLYRAETNSRSFTKDDDFFSVGMPCPVCHGPLDFHTYNVDNIGPFSCPSCGFGSDLKGDYVAEDIDFENRTFTMGGRAYAFNFNTPYFLYCYVLALGVAKELGVSDGETAAALEAFRDIRGRMEDRQIAGKTLHYLKMKQENSETLQSSLELVCRDSSPKIFLIGFDEYLDFYPPMTIPFCIFDCDLRGLLRSRVDKWICMSAAMGKAAAIRFLYDGFPAEDMVTLTDSTEPTVAAALEKLPGDSAYLIEEIPYWKKK